MLIDPSLSKEEKVELAMIAINVLGGIGVPKDKK